MDNYGENCIREKRRSLACQEVMEKSFLPTAAT